MEKEFNTNKSYKEQNLKVGQKLKLKENLLLYEVYDMEDFFNQDFSEMSDSNIKKTVKEFGLDVDGDFNVYIPKGTEVILKKEESWPVFEIPTAQVKKGIKIDFPWKFIVEVKDRKVKDSVTYFIHWYDLDGHHHSIDYKDYDEAIHDLEEMKAGVPTEYKDVWMDQSGEASDFEDSARYNLPVIKIDIVDIASDEVVKIKSFLKHPNKGIDKEHMVDLATAVDFSHAADSAEMTVRYEDGKEYCSYEGIPFYSEDDLNYFLSHALPGKEDYLKAHVQYKMNRLQDTKEQYLYLFPSDGWEKRDSDALISYNLIGLGRNKDIDMSGEENGYINIVVQGSKEDLERFGEEYLGGYQLHPDYLYKKSDFAGEIFDSVKDADVDDSKYSKAEEAAKYVAKALKGECGAFAGEDPIRDGAEVILYSQGPFETYEFTEDGKVIYKGKKHSLDWLSDRSWFMYDVDLNKLKSIFNSVKDGEPKESWKYQFRSPCRVTYHNEYTFGPEEYEPADDFLYIINDALSDTRNNGEYDLAKYINGRYGLHGIDSISLNAVESNEKYSGGVDCITTVIADHPLNDEEIESLKDYIEGQFADGYGEGFEQAELDEIYLEEEVEDYDEETGERDEWTERARTSIYCSLWNRRDWYINLVSAERLK